MFNVSLAVDDFVWVEVKTSTFAQAVSLKSVNDGSDGFLTFISHGYSPDVLLTSFTIPATVRLPKSKVAGVNIL